MTDIFQLTRKLVDIESVTNHEAAVGECLLDTLSPLSARFSGQLERCPVKADRFNVFAHWGDPLVTLSTHMDTVPPFFPSREDADSIWGRGSADAKGIIASMIGAAEGLLESGVRDFGLLFVVGEERNSAGALAAARNPRGSRFLINGEPTENKLALATKGLLRCEIEARGKLAHSAYPELGDSAIEKLLDALQQIRRMALPEDPVLGRSTLNIGVISGGRAPNVVPDAAMAELAIRLVGDAAPVREALIRAVGDRAEVREILCIPEIRFDRLDGFETSIVAFTTDVPVFGNSWGKPYLLGPGTIHVAHTSEERVSKKELLAASVIYQQMVKRLLAAA
ncbi:MAG: peptidase dimerization protein [Acidobacteria bacterium]|nr:MAG: peptidase dimerization protein [Acidobacteriota bacterium]